MEKRGTVLALALTLPLALYGIPYAYAATTSSSYVVWSGQGSDNAFVHCNTGDYATGGGAETDTPGSIFSSLPMYFNGTNYNIIDNGQPNAWGAHGQSGAELSVRVVCQTPITVAGVTVPEFGSLYVAIALGAVVYFMLARKFTSRQALPAQAY